MSESLGRHFLTRSYRHDGPALLKHLERRYGRGRARFAMLRLGVLFSLCPLVFGRRRAHLLSMFAAFMNGASHCVNGHARAFLVHDLRARERLFPLEVGELLELSERPDAQALQVVRAALIDEGCHAEWGLLSRMYELKAMGEVPRGLRDLLLSAMIEINDCINVDCIAGQWRLEDDADDAASGRLDAKTEYARRRLASGQGTERASRKPRPPA